MKHLNSIDKLGYLFLSIVLLIGLYFGFTNVTYFDTVFSAEDGAVEYTTALLLFCISLLCIYRLFNLWSSKPTLWKIGVALFALLFFFGAGEEISWGQRIFNVESSEFFKANNAQGETNLHNLVVGGKKINKLVFSQLLMLVMVLYLLVVPVLYRKTKWLPKLANMFAVPIVKWHHTIAFLTATLLVAINPSDRKWEVYELAFGVIFFLIFLSPLNNKIFQKR